MSDPETKCDDENLILSLPKSLTVSGIDDFFSSTPKPNEKTKLFSIDARAVTEIDGAGLQMVLYFVHLANQFKLSIIWVDSYSAAFKCEAQRLGLMNALLLIDDGEKDQ